MKRSIFNALGLLEIFVALMAIPAGLAMVLVPGGTGIGIPIEILEGSPFRSFLIPGLFLLVMNGIFQAIGAVLAFRKHEGAGLAGIALGITLTLWILVQVFMIGLISWLQPFFLLIGIAQTWLGFRARG